MFIAAAKLILDYYGNTSLPSKRAEIRALLKDIQKTFNVSAVEVEDHDDFERCVLGLTLVASTEAGAKSALKRMLEHIDANSFARVVMEDSHVARF